MRGTSGFRADIEGLRGVAVLLVVLYHANVPFVTGGFVGVDVFFVLSGYLITGLLWRERETTGRIDFAGFYARRIRRLLPAAALVLAVTALVGLAIYTPLEQLQHVKTAFAAAAYSANLWLGHAAGDYFAPSVGTDPLLHMWSLAVEEQFYLAWPLLLAGLVAVTRRRAMLVVAGLAAIGLVSYAGSYWFAFADPVRAFYSTPLRAWEFAAGGCLALVPAAACRPSALRMVRVLGWGLVLGSAVLLGEQSTFPGPGALPVVAGTFFLLLPGHVGERSRVLDTGALQTLGRYSYSWYLWHWPVLVTVRALGGDVGWMTLAVAAAGSLVPAVLAYHTVEMPLRHRPALVKRPRRTLAFGGALTAASLVLMAGYQGIASVRSESPAFARVLHARDYRFPETEACISTMSGPDVECAFGPADGTPVVLYGDSHAWQWAPALIGIAEDRGWRLTILTKSACPAVSVLVSRHEHRPEDCVAWRARAHARIAEIRPASIIVGQTQYYFSHVLEEGEPLTLIERATDVLALEARSLGARLFLIGDNPRFGTSVPECLARRLAWIGRDESCDQPRDHAFTPGLLEMHRRVDAEHEHVRLIDMTDLLCSDIVCPAELDGEIAYFDSNHLTPWTVTRLRPELEAALSAL